MMNRRMLVLRGIVLRAVAVFLAAHIIGLVAIWIAIAAAPVGALVLNLNQGLRAGFIVAQLSVLTPQPAQPGDLFVSMTGSNGRFEDSVTR